MTDYLWVEDTVREIVTDLVLQVEEEHGKHLTEELRLQSRQLDAYAARIAALEAALRPFAAIADDSTANLADNYMYPDCYPMSAFRAAKAALEKRNV